MIFRKKRNLINFLAITQFFSLGKKIFFFSFTSDYCDVILVLLKYFLAILDNALKFFFKYIKFERILSLIRAKRKSSMSCKRKKKTHDTLT